MSICYITSHLVFEFIGTAGYMYCFTLKDNVYVANAISTLILPTDTSHLQVFKKTLCVLFKWKDFLCDTIHTLKTNMAD